MRALETSQFRVANAAALLAQNPIAVLYIAKTLAHDSMLQNRALIQLKSQLQTGEPNDVKDCEQARRSFSPVDGASLVYAGYPDDPFK